MRYRTLTLKNGQMITDGLGFVQSIVMFFVSHVRQALASLGELWRQPLASLMTIGVLGLSITLPSTLYIMVKNTEKITAGWDQASEISLFLKPDINAASSQQLVARLNSWSEIDSVVYIPADDALKEFQHLSGLGDAIAYLEKNPLPDVVLVTPNEKHASPTAAKALLDKLRQQREVGLLLFIAVVLIIGNTIRLNILNKYDEIVVMKLVGATDAFQHHYVCRYVSEGFQHYRINRFCIANYAGTIGAARFTGLTYLCAASCKGNRAQVVVDVSILTRLQCEIYKSLYDVIGGK